MVSEPATDMLLLAWFGVLFLPSAIAFARGGLYGVGWWVLANLLIGWNPMFWLMMLMLAKHRRIA